MRNTDAMPGTAALRPKNLEEHENRNKWAAFHFASYYELDVASEANYSRRIMLDSLHVEAYRGLHNLRIDHLSRFNFLVGPGGSGKTSLLEAAFLLCAETSGIPLFTALMQRVVRPRYVAEFENQLLSFLPINDGGRSILSGSFSGQQRRRVYERVRTTAEVSIGNATTDATTSDFMKTPAQLKVSTVTDAKELIANVRVSGGQVSSETHTDAFPARLHGVGAHLGAAQGLAKLWSVVQDKGCDGKIIEHLQRMRPSLRAVRVAVAGEDQAIIRCDDDIVGTTSPEFLGDSFLKTLCLSCNVVAAAGGLMSVDEIDVSLHPSVLSLSLDLVFRLAMELNVQLLASTHRLDVIDAALGVNQRDDMRVLRLRPADRGPVNEIENLDEAEVRYRREELGIDLRWTA